MDSFTKHLRETRTAWLNLPIPERVDLITNTVSRIDSDAIAKMKMAGRECVRKGKYTQGFLSEFYEMIDDWLAEITNPGEQKMPVYQKVAIITYARNLAM